MPDSKLRWQSALNRRTLICVFLGFTSGLPLFILLSLLQAWLAKMGWDVKSLGLLALVMFPYTWKFLWSPATGLRTRLARRPECWPQG